MIFASAQDITSAKLSELERKKQERVIQQQSKMAAMGKMLAIIAHQWRQPLAKLNGLYLNMEIDFQEKKLNQTLFNKYLLQMEDTSMYLSTLPAISSPPAAMTAATFATLATVPTTLLLPMCWTPAATSAARTILPFGRDCHPASPVRSHINQAMVVSSLLWPLSQDQVTILEHAFWNSPTSIW